MKNEQINVLFIQTDQWSERLQGTEAAVKS